MNVICDTENILDASLGQIFNFQQWDVKLEFLMWKLYFCAERTYQRHSFSGSGALRKRFRLYPHWSFSPARQWQKHTACTQRHKHCDQKKMHWHLQTHQPPQDSR